MMEEFVFWTCPWAGYRREDVERGWKQYGYKKEKGLARTEITGCSVSPWPREPRPLSLRRYSVQS